MTKPNEPNNGDLKDLLRGLLRPFVKWLYAEPTKPITPTFPLISIHRQPTDISYKPTDVKEMTWL